MKHLIASLFVLVSFVVTLNATSHSEMFSIGDLSIRSKERGFQEIKPFLSAVCVLYCYTRFFTHYPL